MSYECMITTIDNPFDPFEQFTSWFLFDTEKGYNTCSYLARIARISDQLSEKENNEEIERAIDEIIKYDFMNIYKKVKREITENSSKQETINKQIEVTAQKTTTDRV